MADTKWLDPVGWTMADWEDNSITVLVDHLWNTLKGASDERQAFAEITHSAGFDVDNEFPNLSDFKNLLSSLPDGDWNPAQIIERAVLNPALTVIKTTTIKADGTASASAFMEFLTLAQILTDVLGYASGTLLHMTDTLDGSQRALLQKIWLTQWFQVMDYPKYYAQRLSPSGTDFFDEFEVQFIHVRTSYSYDTGTSTPGLDNATCYIISPTNTSSAVNVYIANDLNETAAFSTNQEVFDYTVAQNAAERATRPWLTTSGWLSPTITQGATFQARYNPSVGGGEYDISSIIVEERIRFKPNASLRALSPEEYQAKIHLYFYLTTSSSLFNAFGESYTEGGSNFIELTADVDGWDYVSFNTPDWSLFTVPASPTTYTTVIATESNTINTLAPDNLSNLIVEPNNSNGAYFEYYTPST